MNTSEALNRDDSSKAVQNLDLGITLYKLASPHGVKSSVFVWLDSELTRKLTLNTQEPVSVTVMCNKEGCFVLPDKYLHKILPKCDGWQYLENNVKLTEE